MKKLTDMIKRWLRSPRLRQGGYNTVLCTAVCLMLVLVVVLVDWGEDKNGWQTDLSFNAITTTGETTSALLKSLDKDVRIYAVFSDGSEDNQLIALLNRYQAECGHITWSQENITRNPLLLQMISDYEGDASVTSDCVILYCEKTGRTRILSSSDYYEYSYDSASGNYAITGWTYEKSLSEAILYVTMDELPTVQVLQGHGELNEGDISVMKEKLIENNYAVKMINLLGGDTLDPESPLMILSPMKDVTTGELELLTAYVQAGGDLFITVDWSDPDDLPNLYALYRMYGFEPIPGLVLADTDDKGSYYESTPNLLPAMLTTELTGVLVTGKADSVLMAGARAFETPQNTSSVLTTEVLLESGNTAYIRQLSTDGTNVTVNYQEGDRQGTFALALSAHRFYDTGYDSRAFIIGNSSMFLDDWMFTYTYSGELMLQALQYIRGEEDVQLDILPRKAAREQLTYESAAMPAVLLALAPIIVAVLAAAVLRPRKHL